MDPLLIDADEERRAAGKRFQWREFRRIAAMAWPYRGKLALGMVLAVFFVALHTVSIAGVFPVLKILLEREGLTGWVDRTVASERLGAHFAPPAEEARRLRVVAVAANGPLAAEGDEVYAGLTDPAGRPAAELLHEIAHAPAGTQIKLQIAAGSQPRVLTVTPRALDWRMRGLRWGASWLPADADQDKLHTLMYILGALVTVVALANVCRYFGEVLVAEGVLRALVALRARLYERVLLLPMSFFAAQPTADIVTRFVQDVQEIQRGLLTLFGKFVREPLKVVFILGLAFALDWRITLAMVVVAPLAVLVFWQVGRSVKKASRRLLQSYGAMIGALTTTLHNLRVVKAYTAEQHEQRRLRDVDRKVIKQQIKLAKLEAFISPMMETIAVVAASLVTVWLASRVLSSDLSLSKFVGLGVVASSLFDPLRKLSDVYVRLQRSTAGAERVFSVMDQRGECEQGSEAVELGPLAERIDFEHVTFTYPGSEVPALQDITFSVERGETIAIVGPNGCGKTTLMSLLPRFFSPDAGAVRYDGADLRQTELKSLRRQISLVSQEAIVFAGTPLENIAYGPDEPDLERAQAAAKQAFADEFIRALPGGYTAALGERGTTLSGGQRQRLAIARAIYRDAPILIFDEATSQIDSESELRIQQALRALAVNRTTFIIAHRFSTIKFARRIVVMDEGRVLDIGTHPELYERCPLYRTLCETQLAEHVVEA